jgi:hypothetical protein
MVRSGVCLVLAMLLDAKALAQPAPVPRSAVFDHAAAREKRERADFSGVIVVEGVDDERRRPLPPAEQRFAATLTRAPAPRDPRRLAAVVPDATPCVALPSTLVPVGGSYNAHGFCP